MSATAPAGASTAKQPVYMLQGTLLEACSCKVLCPCWIGENPDTGSCDAFVSYHFDNGVINGVDVSGLDMIMVALIPGNVLVPKSWRILVLVADRATETQMNALLDAYTGKLGGPLADLAQLVGEVLGVERVPIKHDVRGGKGTLSVGSYINAEMEPFRSGDGTITTLRDSIFSTIPGSPAYVSKATRHEVNIPQFGMQWIFEGRNAIQGDYMMEYAG